MEAIVKTRKKVISRHNGLMTETGRRYGSSIRRKPENILDMQNKKESAGESKIQLWHTFCTIN